MTCHPRADVVCVCLRSAKLSNLYILDSYRASGSTSLLSHDQRPVDSRIPSHANTARSSSLITTPFTKPPTNPSTFATSNASSYTKSHTPVSSSPSSPVANAYVGADLGEMQKGGDHVNVAAQCD